MFSSRKTALVLLAFFGVLMSGQGAGASREILHGHVPAVVGKLPAQGRLPATNLLHLAIGLPLRNPSQLDELIRQQYDPASANYRQFITPQEFTDRFGPTQSDYDALLEFVRTNGFQVEGKHPNRVLVDVVGTVSAVEQTFAIKLQKYHHPKEARDFYAPDTDPSVQSPVPLLNVSGLDNYSLPHPNLKAQPAATPRAGSGPGGAYRGYDFRTAYVPGNALTGAGQSVGLLQFDGYYSSDISSYISQAGLNTSVSLVNVAINGGVSTPGVNNVEVCLDIEMAVSMAPGLSKVYVYEAPNGTAWSTILSKMANDNLAKQLSCSWGGGGPDATSEQIFKQMAAQGQSFFNATGDSDAFVGAISFPSESTNITQVGGTTLNTAGDGSYAYETTWNWGNGTGSSGGVSTTYKIPGWQSGISMAANGGSTTYRNIPDVAMTGDNIYVVYNNGSSGAFGGTSCSAPLWAGFMALVNQQAAIASKPPVGFVNPALYAMVGNAGYSTNFHDITTGNNTSASSPANYYAVAGYDLCTGLGTPNGNNLINALVPTGAVVYAPAVTNGSWTLVAESATPANGAIDPGETVSVRFTLQNNGNLATTNLVATLQAGAGVMAPGGAQNYGALAALGGTGSQTFSFTAAGTCGSNITATLQLREGTNNLGTASFVLLLGNPPLSGQILAQNFDGAAPAALPSGWTSVNISGAAAAWVTTTAVVDSAPNSAFIADAANAGQNALVSPAISITATNAQLSFRHNYIWENSSSGVGKNKTHTYNDGGVLEIQIGSGAFTDFVTAGGSFVSGGYTAAINSTGNPLNGRSAWVATSSGWQTVTARLPAAAAGKSVRLRWNGTTDATNASTATGWYVDSITVTDTVPASCLAVFTDIAVSQSLATNSLSAGQNLVYTLTVTNLGPQPTENLVVTDAVPANTTFISASAGGVYSAGVIIFSAGMLPVGSGTNYTVVFAPVAGVVFTNVVTAATITPEVSGANNQSILTAAQVAASSSVSIGGFGGVVMSLAGTSGSTYVLEATTNLFSSAAWLPLATNTLGSDGILHFNDAQSAGFAQRYFRLRLVQ